MGQEGMLFNEWSLLNYNVLLCFAAAVRGGDRCVHAGR